MLDRVATRLWAKDPEVFAAAADPDARASITQRLGWLDAPVRMRDRLEEIRAVVRSVEQDGLTSLCVLGMGGSSLCAEVLRLTLASDERRAMVHVLDTTDERAIRSAADALPPASTLFIVATKSGATVEVTALESYFRAWLQAAGIADPGRHFVAITDPGTSMVAHATAHHYRHLFINPEDIGGRFSALSLFGLVPAALMGLDPARLLDEADPMAQACRTDDADNPGLALGQYMADEALKGRDKLTLLLPPTMSALGLWIEQLVAESTGKQGLGVLPIVDEPQPAQVDEYGRDRAFVLVSEPGDDRALAHRQALLAAGHPVMHLHSAQQHLGAEFFRWEFATAVAGVRLKINPFDEPNVRDAKSRTQALLSVDGPLPVTPPLLARGEFLGRTHRGDASNPAGSFVAILDYLPPDVRRADAVAQARATIRRQTKAATTYGAGPRYLHSTGQFHKGGTNAGLFLLLTGEDAAATPVPGAGYTFSRLKHAQALGDYDALAANGRHVVHVHINDAGADFSAALLRVVTEATAAPRA